jgi:hypothetical protein
VKILDERPDNLEDAIRVLLKGVEKQLGSKIENANFIRKEETRLHYHIELANGREMKAIIHAHKLKGEYALRFTGNYI